MPLIDCHRTPVECLRTRQDDVATMASLIDVLRNIQSVFAPEFGARWLEKELTR